MAESVRAFKLWLFGLVGSHGGAAGRFVPQTMFTIGGNGDRQSVIIFTNNSSRG